MGLHKALESLRSEHHLQFILAISEEGMVMGQAGEAPEESFAAYAPMAVETSRSMAHSGEFGDLLCSAMILEDRRMLIMHSTSVAGRMVYVTLMCRKVPSGLQALLAQITAEVARALGE